MNYYVVVEGAAEKKVYETWIPLINTSLTSVDYFSEIHENNFLIVSGNGYPNFFKIVGDAIEDIKTSGCPIKLVACIDAEDSSYQEKYSEVEQYIRSTGFSGLNYSVVVQYFCFETWALGNSRVGPRQPKHVLLSEYKNFYDVLNNDPENLSGYGEFNRSQFALRYLQQMIRDKVHHGTYSKSNPRVVQHPSYFQEIQLRFSEKNHIQSFGEFLKAFT